MFKTKQTRKKIKKLTPCPGCPHFWKPIFTPQKTMARLSGLFCELLQRRLLLGEPRDIRPIFFKQLSRNVSHSTNTQKLWIFEEFSKKEREALLSSNSNHSDVETCCDGKKLLGSVGTKLIPQEVLLKSRTFSSNLCVLLRVHPILRLASPRIHGLHSLCKDLGASD